MAPVRGGGLFGESRGRHGVQAATRPPNLVQRGTSVATYLLSPQKTKFSPVVPSSWANPAAPRPSNHMYGHVGRECNPSRADRGARALLGVRWGAPGAPEYNDAESYERHPDDVVQVDPVATAREVKDNDVPAVRVKANHCRPSEDCNRCPGSAQHACRGYAAVTSGRSSSGTNTPPRQCSSSHTIAPSTSHCSTGYRGIRTMRATNAVLFRPAWLWSSPTSAGALTARQRGRPLGGRSAGTRTCQRGHDRAGVRRRRGAGEAARAPGMSGRSTPCT